MTARPAQPPSSREKGLRFGKAAIDDRGFTGDVPAFQIGYEIRVHLRVSAAESLAGRAAMSAGWVMPP
jgi:hypothetical protein